MGYSSSSSLLKFKLNSYDGNPLKWPKWSSIFIGAVEKRTISELEKKSQLRALLTGKAKSAVSGKGH